MIIGAEQLIDTRRLPFIRTHLPPEKEVEVSTRYGTIVEKGIELTEEMLIRIEEKMQDRVAFYTVYPDLWADEILLPASSSFRWTSYQRVQLRQQARVPLNHITGARGVSKTFTGVFGFFHRAIFLPGSSLAITAPSKSQAAAIARQTVNDILSKFPTLQNEMDGNPVGTKDSYLIRFRNKSTIEVTAALESTRGRRFDAILVDESRDQKGDLVNGILVPTVSKIRLTAGAGLLNPYEPQQAQWYYSSASSKSSYNYEKVLDLFIKMIINPNASFTMGLDYRVPVIEGVYPASFVRDIRLDSTMDERLFAREFLSHFTAENDESWFNFKKLNAHRKIVNAQWEARPSDKKDNKIYFIISVDVGRLTDNTVATIFKVIPNRGKHRAIVTNIYMLGKTSRKKQFEQQVIDIKKLVRAYQPREVIVDTNGLGIAIADLVIKEQIDSQGNIFPAYGFSNDKEYQKIQPKDAPRIFRSFKATQTINSEMFGNTYSRIDAGLVDFLIKEQDARMKLLATKRGQKMSVEQKTKFLMPYEMTSKLFEEMGNMRLRRTGTGLQISLEPINSRFPDDRFSSLCIGLRRIKEIEEQETRTKRSGGPRRLVFFSGGKNGR